VKFPDILGHSPAALGMLSVAHIMPTAHTNVTVSGGDRNATARDPKPYI